MKMCQPHWGMMRESVKSHGMEDLVAKSAEAAHTNQMRQLEEHRANGEVSDATLRDTFDPLMSMNWHFANAALRCGGLAMMTPNEDGSARCPVCEFVKNCDGFDAKAEIDSVADAMQVYCQNEGLIPKAS